jgi:bifunctional non-homologous end joining protein LigD
VALDEYSRKRDFSRTPEPAPAAAKGSGDLYVIQKHRASSLHYDLRLECDGVLLSWAVPKGPSLDPSVKRLAVRTEDHPLEYAGFEGVIPREEYGGGVVIVWDNGTFRNVKDVPLAGALENGQIEIRVEGRKLKGTWALVQMKGRGEKNWLLIKMKDECADRQLDVTEAQPNSVLTGRSLDDVASEEGGRSG